MADREILKSVEYLSFSGSATQTISIASNYTALVQFLDLSSASAVTVDVKAGITQVWKGTTNDAPIQLNFGEGRGSGVLGDDITVQCGGAIEVFVGVKQVLSS